MKLSTMLLHMALYACAYSGLRFTIAIIEGNDLCFTISHAPAVPRDTAGVCAICSMLIGRYNSLSKTNPCLYVIKRGVIPFKHLGSDVTRGHHSLSSRSLNLRQSTRY